jgi:hypothetical protein
MKYDSQFPVVFLVGCPRSGTTFLQSLLAAHPDIASFPESQFFQYLIPGNSTKYGLGLTGRNLKARVETYFRDELGYPELAKNWSRIGFRKRYAQKLIGILQQLAHHRGKRILLEKTPQHIYYVQHIEKFFPGAKIVHLLRNGYDVIASLYEVTAQYPQFWGGKPWSLEKCLNWWIQAVQISSNHFQQPDHYVVRYENLIASPENVLAEICDFIGVEFDRNMLYNFPDVAKNLSRDGGGRTVTMEIPRTGSKKFDRVFNHEQQNYVVQRLAEVGLDSTNLI